MKTVLIDGDQIAYLCAFACEREIEWDEDTINLTTSKSDLRDALDQQVQKAKRETEATSARVALSNSTNFRKDLFRDYKANRTARKPLGLKYCCEYLTTKYKAETYEGIEADDLIGIWAANDYDNIIWATDKDYLTVPCMLYRNGRMMTISEEEADYYLRLQTMVGDTADNYKGAKGFGEKTAVKWLKEYGDSWESVEKAFKKAGQTKDEFLTNAKLARILRSFEDINWYPDQPQ